MALFSFVSTLLVAGGFHKTGALRVPVHYLRNSIEFESQSRPKVSKTNKYIFDIFNGV